MTRLAFFGLSLLLVLCLGCSSNLPTYEVAGSVEFEDGSYPKFGDVEFYSAEHKINARGKIQRDGTFTLTTYIENDGAVAGVHDVIIMQQIGNYLIGKEGLTMKHDHGSLIDPAYIDYRTSNLKIEISPGKNEVKLLVKKKKKQTADGMPLHH